MQLSGHQFEHTLGDSEGHGSLAHYSPWGHDLVTEQKQDECVYVFIHKIHLYPQNLLPYPFL